MGKVFDDIVRAIKASDGKPIGETIEAISIATYGLNSSQARFQRWMNANRHRIPEACRELGIEPPVEGPHLYRRLYDVVLPLLK